MSEENIGHESAAPQLPLGGSPASADRAVGLALLILTVGGLVVLIPAAILEGSVALFVLSFLQPFRSQSQLLQPNSFGGSTSFNGTQQQETVPWLVYLLVFILLAVIVTMIVAAVGVMRSKRRGLATTLVIWVLLSPVVPVLSLAVMSYCVLRLNRFLGPVPT